MWTSRGRENTEHSEAPETTASVESPTNQVVHVAVRNVVTERRLENVHFFNKKGSHT